MTISKRGRPKGQPGRCSVCKGSGHNSRSCTDVKYRRKVWDTSAGEDPAIAGHTAEEQDDLAARNSELASAKTPDLVATATVSYFGSQLLEEEVRSLTPEEESFLWVNHGQPPDSAGTRPALNPHGSHGQGCAASSSEVPARQSDTLAQDVHDAPLLPNSPSGIRKMPAVVPLPSALHHPSQEEGSMPVVAMPQQEHAEELMQPAAAVEGKGVPRRPNSLELSLNLKLASSPVQRRQGDVPELPLPSAAAITPAPSPPSEASVKVPAVSVEEAVVADAGNGSEGGVADVAAKNSVQLATPQMRKSRENRLREILAMTGGVSPTSRMPLLSLRPPQAGENDIGNKDGREKAAAAADMAASSGVTASDLGSPRPQSSVHHHPTTTVYGEEGGGRAVVGSAGGRPPLGRLKRVMVAGAEEPAGGAVGSLSMLGRQPVVSAAEHGYAVPPPPKRQMVQQPAPGPALPFLSAAAQFPWAQRLQEILAMELPAEAVKAAAAGHSGGPPSSSSSPAAASASPQLGSRAEMRTDGSSGAAEAVPADVWRAVVEDMRFGTEDINSSLIQELIHSIRPTPLDASLARWPGPAVVTGQDQSMDSVGWDTDHGPAGDSPVDEQHRERETSETEIPSISADQQQQFVLTTAAAINFAAASHAAATIGPTTGQLLVPHIACWFTGMPSQQPPTVSAVATAMAAPTAARVGAVDATPADLDLCRAAVAPPGVEDAAGYQQLMIPSLPSVLPSTVSVSMGAPGHAAPASALMPPPLPRPPTVAQVLKETLSRHIQEAVAEHIHEAVAKQIHEAVAEQLQEVLHSPDPTPLPSPLSSSAEPNSSPPATTPTSVAKPVTSTPATTTSTSTSTLAPKSSPSSPGSRPPPAKSRALFERRRPGLTLGDGKSVRQRCIESRGGRELSVEVPLPRRVFSSMRKSSDSMESLGAELVANRCSPKSSPELLARCPAQIF